MLDPIIPVSMIFTLLLVLLIGGFIVLFPVTRRLGEALEAYLERRREKGAAPEEIARLRREVRALRSRVESVAEKQEFVEALLEEKSGGRLSGEPEPTDGKS